MVIGEAATLEARKKAFSIAESTLDVEGVRQMMSMHLGPDSVVLTLKVAFRRGLSSGDVERITDDMERATT